MTFKSLLFYGILIIAYLQIVRNRGDVRGREEKYRLVISVKEIRGKCPVFNVGDRIVAELPKIIVKKTDNSCVHAFGCILSMIVALSLGISFKQ